MTKLIYSRMLASVSYKDHPYAKEGEIFYLAKKSAGAYHGRNTQDRSTWRDLWTYGASLPKAVL